MNVKQTHIRLMQGFAGLTFFLLLRTADLLPERFSIAREESTDIAGTTGQGSDEEVVNLPIPDGQERLATQSERDDVNQKIERAHSSRGSC